VAPRKKPSVGSSSPTRASQDLNHVEFNARCLLPGLFVGEDGNNPYAFLQRPGAVVIRYNHISRVII
jgi:hypothetical protein